LIQKNSHFADHWNKSTFIPLHETNYCDVQIYTRKKRKRLIAVGNICV